MSSLWRRVRKKELRLLIEAAIRTPTVSAARGRAGAVPNAIGVPQGLAISNILAEIAMEKIDQEVSGYAGVWFCRYVDDILILTEAGKAEKVADSVIKKLKRMKLEAHPIAAGSKTVVGPLGTPFGFLGYWTEGRDIVVRRESVLRFESSIARILTAYIYRVEGERSRQERERALAYCKWKLNLRITGCVFEGRRLGWASYFSQITSTRQLRSINHTIERMLRRFGLFQDIKPKSLVKVFYELRRSEGGSRYIPNFDAMTNQQKRERLAMWFGNKVDGMSDAEVDRRLVMKLAKAVRGLEADIAHAS